jgi:Ca2+-binding RTX toxin-like protein
VPNIIQQRSLCFIRLLRWVHEREEGPMGRRTFGVVVALSALAVFTTGWAGESALAVPTCFGLPATIVVPTLANENRQITGTSGDDVIVSGAGNDIIFGGGGDDRICARRGRDVVYGWEGNDHLSGARGGDRLYPEMGNDVIRGGAGSDGLSGGVGSDLMWGGPGTDTAGFIQENLMGPIIVDLGAGTARGASGEDVLSPGTIENVVMNCSAEQDDVLIGDDRPNILTGGSGADLIRGNGGTDALYGGTPGQDTGDAILAPVARSTPLCTLDDGPDQLFGGLDDDRLYGQKNDDVLDGEEGTDELDGGLGTDACRNGESLVACET